MGTIIFILIIVLLIFILFKWTFKIPRCGNMVLITGGIKTGKTMLSVRMVYKTWKKQKLKAKIFNFFKSYFSWLIPKLKNSDFKPMPLIYSNVPLKLPYVPLTQELIMRQKRFVYGSVIYVCESSLVADSMSYKDDLLNENMLLLNKLIAHSTKGGYIFYDTQSISDNHYAIRRCLASYFYIHHTIKIPFFVLAYVRELKFSEDSNEINTFNEDIEDTLKVIVIPKKTWRLYDRYCYSILTDNLAVEENVIEKTENLKTDKIITFKNFKTIKTVVNNDDQENNKNGKEN